MFESLSPAQQEIAYQKDGLFTVRACPGSGKTYSVSARLAHLLTQWEERANGIATLSFTNIAWKEIEKNLTNANVRISYPHFLGTIDSFINQYIFLPFGHLLMNCSKRPTLVGPPHRPWMIKRYENDYDQYFDKVSYTINNQLLYPQIPSLFFFGFSKLFKADGSESAHAVNIREVKKKYWQKGYATQADANYFGLRLLEKYPCIADAIIHRFPSFIIDEAQDTSEIQMAILDVLLNRGLQEVLLIGDQDQAIYEWNEAKPSLFTNKFNIWRDNSVTLNENRRSSQLICNFTKHLSSLSETSTAVNEEVKDLRIPPNIWIYNESNVKETIDIFMDKCRDLQIPISTSTVAVLFRSGNFYNEKIREVPLVRQTSPWVEGDLHSRNLILGKFQYDNLEFKEGFTTIEKAIHGLKNGNTYVTHSDIQEEVRKVGFSEYRRGLYNIISGLPNSDCLVGDWILEANEKLQNAGIPTTLQIKEAYQRERIADLSKFDSGVTEPLPYKTGTVHSVKGETYDAVLLFLRKKVTKNYLTLLKAPPYSDNEELRIVYVAITRPRKFVVIAVPDHNNFSGWASILLPGQ